MTRKIRRKKLGKIIRAFTGIELPKAMRIAKYVLRGNLWDARQRFDCVHELPFTCGWECCGGSGKYIVSGPFGEYELKIFPKIWKY